MVCGNMKTRNVVLGICRAFHCSSINAVLHQDGSKWRTHKDGLADDHMSPSHRHAVLVNANLDSMDVHWTIVAALDIILPCPHKLNGRAAQTFRDHCSLTLQVGIENGAPAKASASHLRVEGDLLR